MSNIARLMLMALVSESNSGSEYWIGVLGGAGTDELYGVAVDSGDNIVVCGRTNSSGAGNDDGLIVKYDTSGELLWSKTLGNSSPDRFNAVVVDSSDNIVVGGIGRVSFPTSYDGLLVKYNPLGTILWTRTFGTTSTTDRISGVTINSSSTIVIVGDIGSIHFYVAGYNSSGTLTYSRFVDAGGYSSDSFNALAIDSANNTIAVGSVYSSSLLADCVIGKYNSAGTQQWIRRLSGTGFDRFSGVAVDASNNIIAVGFSGSVVAGEYVALVYKFNTSGTVLWSRRLDGAGTVESLGAVVVDSNGDIIVVGSTSSGVSGGLIAKYNTSGTLLWARTLVGASGFSAVAVDSADNIIAAGRTSVVGAGGNDGLIVKLPPDGSGTGTYGSFVYQVAAVSSASVSLSNQSLSVTFPNVTVTSAAATFTDSPVTLSEEYFPVNA